MNVIAQLKQELWLNWAHIDLWAGGLPILSRRQCKSKSRNTVKVETTQGKVPGHCQSWSQPNRRTSWHGCLGTVTETWSVLFSKRHYSSNIELATVNFQFWERFELEESQSTLPVVLSCLSVRVWDMELWWWMFLSSLGWLPLLVHLSANRFVPDHKNFVFSTCWNGELPRRSLSHVLSKSKSHTLFLFFYRT